MRENFKAYLYLSFTFQWMASEKVKRNPFIMLSVATEAKQNSERGAFIFYLYEKESTYVCMFISLFCWRYCEKLESWYEKRGKNDKEQKPVETRKLINFQKIKN